jgi:regulator of sigma E protease
MPGVGCPRQILFSLSYGLHGRARVNWVIARDGVTETKKRKTRMSLYVLTIIPVLGLLVFVHELGHFLAAKWAGIHVEEFGMGFPPALVSFRRRERGGWDVLWLGQGREQSVGDTQNPLSGVSGGVRGADTNRPAWRATLYSLNLLPIGGFVRMPGETGDAVDEQGNYDPESFAAKSAGKRIIVLCAGVLMNLVLAFVLFSIAYGVGEPMASSEPVVGVVTQNSPAAAAGLHTNDRILAVGSSAQTLQPVSTFNDMHQAVKNLLQNDKSQSSTVTIFFKIQPAGTTVSQVIPIAARKFPPNGEGPIGISGQVILVKTPFWQAPLKGFVQTFNMLHAFFSAIREMIVGAIQPQIAGPVGIARVTGDVAQLTPMFGWWPLLNLTAFLSLNLAIMNILPFPALDGGRVLLVLIELLRGGKRLKPEREGLINYVGLAILLLLMVIVTANDIYHWGS